MSAAVNFSAWDEALRALAREVHGRCGREPEIVHIPIAMYERLKAAKPPPRWYKRRARQARMARKRRRGWS